MQRTHPVRTHSTKSMRRLPIRIASAWRTRHAPYHNTNMPHRGRLLTVTAAISPSVQPTNGRHARPAHTTIASARRSQHARRMSGNLALRALSKIVSAHDTLCVRRRSLNLSQLARTTTASAQRTQHALIQSSKRAPLRCCMIGSVKSLRHALRAGRRSSRPLQLRIASARHVSLENSRHMPVTLTCALTVSVAISRSSLVCTTVPTVSQARIRRRRARHRA